MSKHIQLHIPEPCHENWSKMTPAEKGRFCGACQKQVVDFTTMSDAQVLSFFNKSKTGSVCGRFVQDQLHRDIEMPAKRIPWAKYFLQFVLPAFLVSTKAAAQGKVLVLTGDTVVMPVTPKIEAIKKAAVSKHEKERIIRGRVIDELGEGISYATIFIKGTTIGVAADSAGTFSLIYPGQEKSIVLVSSCIGFKEVETIIDLNEMEGSITTSLPSNNVLREVIVVASTEIMGAVRLVGLVGAVSIKRRTSFSDTIWNKVFPSKQLLQLYPNPVKSNSPLNIETGKHEKGYYSFQLSATNGQIILSKELWMDEAIGVVKLNIPSIAAGAYFIQMVNKQSGKRTTEKIIVE